MKRALVLGALLSIGIALLEPYLIMMVQGTGFTSDFLPAAAIFSTVVVVFLCAALSLVWRPVVMSSQELFLIFIMVSVAAVVPSWGIMGNLFPVISGLRYFASPENGWTGTVLSRVRPWLTNTDAGAVRGFYEGISHGAGIPFAGWLTPLAVWLGFLLVFSFLSICIAVLFRKQWVEHERLSFPLAVIPQEMFADCSGRLPRFFRNPVMWCGFCIAFVLLSANVINHFSPGAGIRFSQIVKIFRNTDYLLFYLSFPILGVAFLLNIDILFSLWFFFLAAKLVTGVFNISGYALPGGNEVFGGSCAATSFFGGGAMAALAVYVVWIARAHLGKVFRKAVTGDPGIDDSGELLSYRTTVFGLAVSCVLMFVFFRAVGMPGVVALVFLVAALVVFLGLTRIVVQAGVGFARPQCIPPDTVAYVLPPGAVTGSGYAGLGLQYVWSADIRTTVLASTANALKMQETARLRPRLLFWAIIVAFVLAYAASAWMILHIGYRWGTLNSRNQWFFGPGMPNAIVQFVSSKILHPLTADIIGPRLGWTGGGIVVMAALILLRQQFLWWPLHYIGLPICDTWVMQYAWFSILLAWVLKTAILRYGGPARYRKTIPLFLGLVMGAVCALGVWTIVNAIAGEPVNSILIGAS